MNITHSALMWFLPRMSSHMHHEHILSFEWLLIPGAPHPTADESLLAGVDVVCVDMLHQIVLGRELKLAVHLERVKDIELQ